MRQNGQTKLYYTLSCGGMQTQISILFNIFTLLLEHLVQLRHCLLYTNTRLVTKLFKR